MKKSRIIDIISYIFLLSSLIVIIASFNYEINIYLRYLTYFIGGLSLMAVTLFRSNKKLKKEINWLKRRVKLGNSISYRVKIAGEKAFNELPIGIITYGNDFKIEWANNYAKNIFLSPLIDRKISNISKELDVKLRSQTEFDIDLYSKEYNVNLLKDDSIIFFTDKTDYKALETKYFNKTIACGVVSLDNFDEALSQIDPQDKAIILSDIITILSEWCLKYNIYIRGYSEKQYLILMDRKQLEEIMEEGFKVINFVNDYCLKENVRITVSIAVSSFDASFNEVMDKTNELLELALNRGGNQAVVYIDRTIKYFGGKVKGVDSRAPIYVRLNAEELKDLIIKASNILIMPHTNIDADAFGSAIGVLKIAKSFDKQAHIVFDYDLSDPTVQEVYLDIEYEHIGMLDYFIQPSKALINENTLLILVDCQYPKMLVCEKVYKKAKNIAIIDHHRSGSSSISNYKYLYNKTTSSSSVELIVEMIDFFESEVNITNIEATIMLLGIIVDTSNLMYRTSYQTFSVISKLHQYGAEMPLVQRYLREDISMYEKRMSFLQKIEIIDSRYGICVCDDEVYSRQFIAKLSDNVLQVNTCKASFCIGRIAPNLVGISARSLDEENVQIIMEILGGGGHFNSAATQIADVSVLEVKNILIDVLRKLEKEGEQTMKIILVKDVKGKGKTKDIIDIPSGHANYLIRSKQAILATPDNINELERQTELDKIEQSKVLEEMKKVKEKIEDNSIEIKVRVGKEGKLFGIVSTKQIVDEVKNKFDVVVDKRKLTLEQDINKLGTYKIPVLLHKEVQATITLHVVEAQNGKN